MAKKDELIEIESGIYTTKDIRPSKGQMNFSEVAERVSNPFRDYKYKIEVRIRDKYFSKKELKEIYKAKIVETIKKPDGNYEYFLYYFSDDNKNKISDKEKNILKNNLERVLKRFPKQKNISIELSNI